MPSEIEVYIATLARLEPDIAMIDAGAFNASAAISLKHIADSLEKLAGQLTYQQAGINLYDLIHQIANK